MANEFKVKNGIKFSDNTVQTTASTGTVTSVSGTGTVSGLTLSGTITASGSLTLGGTLSVTASNFASQTANTFLAAPNGSAGTPTFRTLVAADIPTLNQNTTGSAATLTTGRTIGMTGDVTWTSASFNGSANVTGTATLANSGVTAGTYTVATVTVDAKGRITSASSGTGGGITISDDTTTNATRYLVFEDVTSGTSSTMQVSSSKLTFNPSTGTLTATAVTASSDERFKANWRQLQVSFVEELSKVKSGTYDRTDTDILLTQDGVSAQSLLTVLPNSVVKNDKGELSVSYGNAALVSAIELAKRVVEQEQRIKYLEEVISKLLLSKD